MKTLSGKELIKLLEKKGWLLARVQGSHHIMTKEGETERLSIPVHGSKDLKRGLQRHLMKIAMIDEREL